MKSHFNATSQKYWLKAIKFNAIASILNKFERGKLYG